MEICNILSFNGTQLCYGVILLVVYVFAYESFNHFHVLHRCFNIKN
jgi:hypothetical protein